MKDIRDYCRALMLIFLVSVVTAQCSRETIPTGEKIYTFEMGSIQLENRYSSGFHLHSNFEVDHLTVLKIEEIEGVQCVIPDRRYTLMIQCGKLFNREEIKEKVLKIFGYKNP